LSKYIVAKIKCDFIKWKYLTILNS
jgi:hypothetical protein